MPPLPPRTRLSLALAIAVPLMLASCGGGGGGGFSFAPFPAANGGGGDAPPPPAPPPGAPKFTVGGTVTGLAGSGLVLQNNAGDDLAIGADGSFSFATSLDDGADYGVTVKTQPTALQVCVAKQAFGTVAGAAVNSVRVNCSEAGADRFGFAANERSNNLTAYTVSADGSLSAATPAAYSLAGTPQHVTAHPSGKKLYASIYVGTQGVTQYTIDPAGTLSQNLNITTGVGTSPVFVGVEPKGRFAYVIGDGQIHRLNIDATTGDLDGSTAVAVAGGNSRKLGFDPDGRFAFVPNGASIEVFRLDQGTGVPISPPVSVALPVGGFVDVATEPSGRFAYVSTGNNPGTLFAYSIDQTTGALTSIGSVPSGNTPFGMAIDPTGRFVYVANRNSHDVSAYAINPRTGALTAVPGQPFSVGGNTPNSVTVDRTGRFAYTANQGDNTISIFTIDRTTGALALQTARPAGANGPQFFALTK
ncbi:lactonase family protein [Variovorax sp. 350MFTsu5.1]|uniref:lactonase family protein n=1 Tax=Variovorax sp. 350MFTsu5.1 TaxID=3158365 RepID=UPI003AAB8786